MAKDYKNIMEAFKMMPLSEDEKSKRHILGRLFGPIATTKDSTRNGRFYNAQLWESALKDEIFLEKVATKSLFLELGHPTDREEIDMSKACACIPEVPKIVNGDLYAYVDILDTPNGRILKTLCDYGFQPGISSRGSGDVDINNEVDPETFFLETFDIVGIPAVKKARLAVCESLDTDNIKLRKALKESLNKEKVEDQEIVKEALSNLKFTLNEDADEPFEDIEIGEPEIVEPDPEFVEPEFDDEEDAEAPAALEEPENEMPNITVGELIDNLSDFDKEAPVEFAPIEIEGVEYKVDAWNYVADDEKLHINLDIIPAEEDDINSEEVAEQPEDATDETVVDEPVLADEENHSDEAIDDGAAELVASLKEMIRQKESLEADAKALKESVAVSDTKVKKLEEELSQYKNSFARLSTLAAESKEAKKEVQKLTEQLNIKEQTIKTLQTNQANAKALTESVNEQANKSKVLAEKLATRTSELEKAQTALNEQAEKHQAEIAKYTRVAKNYKAKYLEAAHKYVEMKASMLGVKTSEITSRLNEGWTFDDVDRVCDKMLESVKPSFGLARDAKVKLVESRQPRTTVNNVDGGYEIDDDLLILAGLKK